MGHTPQQDGKIKPLCNGKFIIADVGMSIGIEKPNKVEESRPSAMIISIGSASFEIESIKALYGTTVPLPIEPIPIYTLPLKLPPKDLPQEISPNIQRSEIFVERYKTVVVIPDIGGDFESAISAVYMAYCAIMNPEDSGTMMSRSEFRLMIVKEINSLNGPETTLETIRELKERNKQSSEATIALIQLGDVIDTGPYSTECVDLFEVLPLVLPPEWAVLKLYGDHDISAMLEKYHFTSGGIYYNRYQGIS